MKRFEEVRDSLHLALDYLWSGRKEECVLIDDEVFGKYKFELIVRDNNLYCLFTYRKVFGRFVKKPNCIYRMYGITAHDLYTELCKIELENLQCRIARRTYLYKEFCKSEGDNNGTEN